MNFYNKIYDFCSVRNTSGARSNGLELPKRVQWILKELNELKIPYILDSFFTSNEYNLYHNIILPGTNSKIVTAHHDIVNPNIDNANDNSCSVINAIALKSIVPEITVVLLDGEECGGVGSQHLTEQIINGGFDKIDWILNLELTGKGGEYFFLGDYPGPLQDHIKSLFNPPITQTPFNDSVIFRRGGLDSCVINSLPLMKVSDEVLNENTLLDYSLLYNCHSKSDSLDTISTSDMKIFTENILKRIVC